MTIYLKGVSDGEPNEEDSLLSLKHQLFLRHSAVKVHKRNCGVLRHNLSEDQVSKWKQQFLENAASVFAAISDNLAISQSSEAVERIAHLEQLVGRLTVALDIEKKALGKHPSKNTWLS